MADLLDWLLCKVVEQQEEQEEVQEVFLEEVVDPNLKSVRHQVYIKDFFWVPLEDQFKDCPQEDKEEVEDIFTIKKLRDLEERRKAVKVLMFKNKHTEKTKDFATRILGPDSLPEIADHDQKQEGSRIEVDQEHCYSRSGKQEQSVPKEVTKLLRKVGSKVEVSKARPGQRSVSSFVGVRPPPRQVGYLDFCCSFIHQIMMVSYV